MIYAIIPARGGSKGIPRKNLIDICGKPLVAWSIEQALASSRIDRVIVSTDDDEIAEVAIDNGAEVIARPADISGDDASTESAISHVLEVVNGEPDLVVLLQPTSPVRTATDINMAIESLDYDCADSLFSSRHIEGYVWQGRRLNELLPVTYGCNGRAPRQQCKALAVEENGSIYAFKPYVFEKYGSRLGGTVTTYVMPASRSFQIDEHSDIALVAEIMERELGAEHVNH
jgi:N-acylneuraminate cytidylyltransferase